ncbi:calmodulin, putative [Bodo saltans]|uniref:Calmodulin, putative n=1 Tax=Bodo saltans TaxID=75058 RepID=A0A0S4JF11_BODSA|nr:calmodulin, putative [Bodo saltans]|eukprot:CUG88870.1 calmodulin, putative [Bodo saltans]
MQSPRGDTEEQREVYDIFSKLSKDGVLPVSSTQSALRSLGQYLTAAAFSELEKEIPAQGVTFEEFLGLFQNVQEINASDADLIEAFGSLDKSRSGFIKSTEVAKLLQDLGGLSAEAAAVVVENADGPNSTMSYDAVVTAISEFVG